LAYITMLFISGQLICLMFNVCASRRLVVPPTGSTSGCPAGGHGWPCPDLMAMAVTRHCHNRNTHNITAKPNRVHGRLVQTIWSHPSWVRPQ